MAQAESVRQYYEHNTRRFLRHGQHDHTDYMHQPLWVHPEMDLNAALNHIHTLILRSVESLDSPDLCLLDLGCGVGGSVCYLAQHTHSDTQLYGITISPLQAQLGQQKCVQLGLANRVTLQAGDYLAIPPEIPQVNLAYSIEAFVHATDAQRYFQQAAQHLLPGGRLLILDDFLTPQALALPAGHLGHTLIKRFRKGWMAESLKGIDEVRGLAENAGLRLKENEDMTPFMRIGRPRDRWIGYLLPFVRLLAKGSPYFRALMGGNAKQRCIKNGWVEYRFLVFEKIEQ